MRHVLPPVAAAAFSLLLAPGASRGADVVCFDNGILNVTIRHLSIVEPPVPIYCNGELAGGHNHHGVTLNHIVPGTNSFPLVLSDIHANTFLRPIYLDPAGAGPPPGTSIIGSVSYRTPPDLLNLIPRVARGDVVTTGPTHYSSSVAGTLPFTGPPDDASVTTTRTFLEAVVGRTAADFEPGFVALRPIPLATVPPFPANDRFRVATFSSMFATETSFDANIIRFEDAQGVIHTVPLTNTTPRDAHLFPAPIALGDWVELRKTSGSTWNVGSPTVRIEIVDPGPLALGVQGFVAASTNPNDDSLSVWLEWLGAPDTIASGTVVSPRLRAIAKAPGRFDDVPPWNPFHTFVDTVGRRSIAGGCAIEPPLYCPDQGTTRAQMAVFLLVAKEGAGYVPPACVAPMFADVPCSSPFARWINELARRGITGGCGGANFCPDAAVTREQMAVFLLVTLEGGGYTPPPCTTPIFDDVPCSSPFAIWINELARRGIAGGCAPRLYCPTRTVTRGEMAVFLVGTFGL